MLMNMSASSTLFFFIVLEQEIFNAYAKNTCYREQYSVLVSSSDLLTVRELWIITRIEEYVRKSPEDKT